MTDAQRIEFQKRGRRLAFQAYRAKRKSGRCLRVIDPDRNAYFRRGLRRIPIVDALLVAQMNYGADRIVARD